MLICCTRDGNRGSLYLHNLREPLSLRLVDTMTTHGVPPPGME
jgi:hypothetical protein